MINGWMDSVLAGFQALNQILTAGIAITAATAYGATREYGFDYSGTRRGGLWGTVVGNNNSINLVTWPTTDYSSSINIEARGYAAYGAGIELSCYDGTTFGPSIILSTVYKAITFTGDRLSFYGNVGFGLSAPQGRLHGKGSNGGGYFALFDALALATTPVEFIPNGAGDVHRAMRVQFVIHSTSDGAGNYVTNEMGVLLGQTVVMLTDSEGNAWSLRCVADGSVNVYRSTTGGTPQTADLIMWALWI